MHVAYSWKEYNTGILLCTMFPLLFMPFPTPSTDQTDDVSYDLKCSEEFGCGGMNVTLMMKMRIGEPSYNVTINTVKVLIILGLPCIIIKCKR